MQKKENFYTIVYRNFRIKVYGYSNGRYYNQLVGVPFLFRTLGRVLSHKILGQALYSNLEVVKFKFRRGLTVTFYAK